MTDLLGRRVRGYSASDSSLTMVEGVCVAIHQQPVYYVVTEDGSLEPWAANLVEETAPGTPEAYAFRAHERTNWTTVHNPEEVSVLEHDDETGAVTGMTADPRYFPSTAWSDALDRVMEAADEAMCDLHDVVDEATGQMCSNPIGWVLHEDDDEPWRSGLSWRQVTLVWTSEGVAAVCEDCSPDVLYGAAAAHARQAREKAAREAAQARAARK